MSPARTRARSARELKAVRVIQRSARAWAARQAREADGSLARDPLSLSAIPRHRAVTLNTKQYNAKHLAEYWRHVGASDSPRVPHSRRAVTSRERYHVESLQDSPHVSHLPAMLKLVDAHLKEALSVLRRPATERGLRTLDDYSIADTPKYSIGKYSFARSHSPGGKDSIIIDIRDQGRVIMNLNLSWSNRSGLGLLYVNTFNPWTRYDKEMKARVKATLHAAGVQVDRFSQKNLR